MDVNDEFRALAKAVRLGDLASADLALDVLARELAGAFCGDCEGYSHHFGVALELGRADAAAQASAARGRAGAGADRRDADACAGASARVVPGQSGAGGMTGGLSAIERGVLRRLDGGPHGSMTFRPAKSVVDRLVARGLAERCAALGRKHRNMIRLTGAGRALVAGMAEGAA